MIPHERLAALLDHALDDAQRAALDRQLETDAEALRFLVDQRRIERVLRSALIPAARRQRLKQSVLAAIAGTPVQKLRANVLAEITGDRPVTPAMVRAATVSPGEESSDPAGGVLVWFAERWRRVVSPKTHTRRWSWSLLTVATVTLFLAIGPWLADLGRSARLGAEIGTLAEVVGVPTLRQEGSRTTIETLRGTSIRLGDRIETGDADRAEIRFNDGTTLRLAFNSAIELPSRSTNQHPSSAAPLRPPEVLLLKGHVWTKVARRTNAPSYAIRTDAATALARGTEFGVKLQRFDLAPTNTPFAIRHSAFAAVLTVKEGAVDFTNAHGSVRATAMTESTARADSAPTEPRRLAALPTAGVDRDRNWPVLTAPLTGSVAAQRLVPGGGWVGLVLREFTNAPSAEAPAGTGPAYEVRIARVEAGSPGDLAGVRPEDQVLSMSGTPVARAGEFERAVLGAQNSLLSLRLRRGDEERIVELVVSDRRSQMPGPLLSFGQMDSLAEITRRLLTGDTAAAERAVGNVLDPVVAAAAKNNLGVRWETDDQLGPAIRAYGRAAQAAPDVPLYRFNLGLALRLIGSYERAAEELGEAARLSPQSTAARQRFAEIQSLLGRDSQALALTEAALKDDPGSHGLWELKAQLLWRQRQLDEAGEAARQAIQLEPSCPVAHAYLGGVLEDQQKAEAAARAYEDSLRLAPFEPSIHFRFARVCQARGQPTEAERHFRQAIALQPGLADAHVQLGLVLSGHGDLAGAERVLWQARELVPDSSEIHNNLGEVLRNQGRSDEALPCFHRAIELDPDNLAPLNNLGILHALRREFTESEKAFRAVAERAPHMKVSALLNLAMAISSQGRVDAAEATYREALTIAPNDPVVWNYLAFFLADHRRNLDEALDLSRRALRAAPDNPGFHDTLGWVLAQRGEFDAAERTLQRAIELGVSGPDVPEIRTHLKRVQDLKSRLPNRSTTP